MEFLTCKGIPSRSRRHGIVGQLISEFEDLRVRCLCGHTTSEHRKDDGDGSCSLCDCDEYREKSWFIDEPDGFTVIPQAGFDVTAALKERGEWPEK